MASDWTLSNPIDHSLNSSWPQEIRNLKYLLKSRLLFQSSEPAARLDGASFVEADNGSIWIDSDDNKVYILTDYETPTWTLISTEIITTLLASAREFTGALSISMADATFTITNTDEEDTDGGRQSQIIFKGEQSGGEASTLAIIEVSHDGASDDQKGKVSIKVNDGDDDNSPSKTAISVASSGVVTLGDGALLAAATEDEDDDRTIADKAYVNSSITATVGDGTFSPLDFSSDLNKNSVTLPNGVIFKWGTKEVASEPTALLFVDDLGCEEAFPNSCHCVQITYNQSISAYAPNAYSLSKTGFTYASGSACKKFHWFAIGS